MRNLCLLSILLFATACGGNTPSTGGALPATTTTFTVTALGAPNNYEINGTDNASLTLKRGQTYVFNLSVTGHPFYIMSVQGTDPTNAYSTGVTGNGSETGTLTFVVPAGAPNTLYYDCGIHAAMTGSITITN